MNTPLVIDVQGLTKSFANKKVVDNVNLSVKKGEVFGFLGPNGSGKTTTIRMLCGLLRPDSGSGHCLGHDILLESKKIKQHVGYMTQKFSFYTDLNVEENFNFIARVYLVPDRVKRTNEILEQLGLQEFRKQLTGSLSGGWKQRVALGACLLHNPSLLLLDEPTAGVDPLARREFWDKIHELSEQGITTLVSTHYMDEAQRCTRLAYLSYGKLLITGTVDTVIKSTGLSTWEISGDVTTHLLQVAKHLSGVVYAAFFGNRLHLSGYDAPLIENSLKQMANQYAIHWQQVESTLEDAFINLSQEKKA